MRIEQKNIRRGFTLIEILVVVAIIGILSTIVIVNVTGAKASSRYTKTVAEMSEIGKATLAYKVEHNGVWPKEWSGTRDWEVTADKTHIFYNNLTVGSPYYNDFLVEYMGGKRFAPDCKKSSYSFYNYTGWQNLFYHNSPTVVGGDTIHVYYMLSGTGEAEFGSGAKDILTLPSKKITCKESSENGGFQ